jgi:beta-xylosidase
MDTEGRLPYGDQGDGTYRNPVLYSDYSDPDVICVDGVYYLTASSFNAMPGLPLLKSQDLVNWQPCGYALERFPHPDYDRPQHGKGVWAPAIRYHDGRFWIFFGTPDEGIFRVTAEDAGGPWSAPHCVQEGKGLIDPCPFWDQDGRAWLVHALAGSRTGGRNSVLILCEMAPDGSRLLDDGKVIIDGHFHHPIVEGPKLYRRGRYYYVFAPAGGVQGGWQAVFRAENLHGPWEDRIVLCQGGTEINGPHQGAWVETPQQEHWFLHFQDRGAAGRILHLQPMEWGADGWPRMGIDPRAGEVHEPVSRHRKPLMAAGVEDDPEAGRLPASDSFTDGQPGWQWQWMANPRPEWVCPGSKGLRLTCQGTPGGNAAWFEAANLLVQKPQDSVFEVRVEISLEDARPGDQGGLVLLSGVSAGLLLEAGEESTVIKAVSLPTREGSLRTDAIRSLDEPSATVILQMREGEAHFLVVSPDGQLEPFGVPVMARFAAWTGARIGLLALNPGTSDSGGRVSFQNFIYRPVCPETPS